MRLNQRAKGEGGVNLDTKDKDSVRDSSGG